jgi:hypothetical protein
VIAAGFPWPWHGRPPKWWVHGTCDGELFQLEMAKYGVPGPMCQTCENQILKDEV